MASWHQLTAQKLAAAIYGQPGSGQPPPEGHIPPEEQRQPEEQMPNDPQQQLNNNPPPQASFPPNNTSDAPPHPNVPPNNDSEEPNVEKTATGGGRCLDCGKEYSRFTNSKIHWREQHQVNNIQYYNCHVCNEQFRSSRQRCDHLIRAHNIHTRNGEDQNAPASSAAENPPQRDKFGRFVKKSKSPGIPRPNIQNNLAGPIEAKRMKLQPPEAENADESASKTPSNVIQNDLMIARTANGGGICLECNDTFSQFSNAKRHFLSRHKGQGPDGEPKDIPKSYSQQYNNHDKRFEQQEPVPYNQEPQPNQFDNNPVRHDNQPRMEGMPEPFALNSGMNHGQPVMNNIGPGNGFQGNFERTRNVEPNTQHSMGERMRHPGENDDDFFARLDAMKNPNTSFPDDKMENETYDHDSQLLEKVFFMVADFNLTEDYIYEVNCHDLPKLNDTIKLVEAKKVSFKDLQLMIDALTASPNYDNINPSNPYGNPGSEYGHRGKTVANVIFIAKDLNTKAEHMFEINEEALGMVTPIIRNVAAKQLLSKEFVFTITELMRMAQSDRSQNNYLQPNPSNNATVYPTSMQNRRDGMAPNFDANHPMQMRNRNEMPPNFGESRPNLMHNRNEVIPNFVGNHPNGMQNRNEMAPNFGGNHENPMLNRNEMAPNFGENHANPIENRNEMVPNFGGNHPNAMQNRNEMPPNFGGNHPNSMQDRNEKPPNFGSNVDQYHPGDGVIERASERSLPLAQNVTFDVPRINPESMNPRIKGDKNSTEPLLCELCPKSYDGNNKSQNKLEHLALTHFKDRLLQDCPNQTSPYKCPVETCSYITDHTSKWIRHYGTVHKLTQRYLKEYLDHHSSNVTSESNNNSSMPFSNQSESQPFPPAHQNPNHQFTNQEQFEGPRPNPSNIFSRHPLEDPLPQQMNEHLNSAPDTLRQPLDDTLSRQLSDKPNSFPGISRHPLDDPLPRQMNDHLNSAPDFMRHPLEEPLPRQMNDLINSAPDISRHPLEDPLPRQMNEHINSAPRPLRQPLDGPLPREMNELTNSAPDISRHPLEDHLPRQMNQHINSAPGPFRQPLENQLPPQMSEPINPAPGTSRHPFEEPLQRQVNEPINSAPGISRHPFEEPLQRQVNEPINCAPGISRHPFEEPLPRQMNEHLNPPPGLLGQPLEDRMPRQLNEHHNSVQGHPRYPLEDSQPRQMNEPFDSVMRPPESILNERKPKTDLIGKLLDIGNRYFISNQEKIRNNTDFNSETSNIPFNNSYSDENVYEKPRGASQVVDWLNLQFEEFQKTAAYNRARNENKEGDDARSKPSLQSVGTENAMLNRPSDAPRTSKRGLSLLIEAVKNKKSTTASNADSTASNRALVKESNALTPFSTSPPLRHNDEDDSDYPKSGVSLLIAKAKQKRLQNMSSEQAIDSAKSPTLLQNEFLPGSMVGENSNSENLFPRNTENDPGTNILGSKMYNKNCDGSKQNDTENHSISVNSQTFMEKNKIAEANVQAIPNSDIADADNIINRRTSGSDTSQQGFSNEWSGMSLLLETARKSQEKSLAQKFRDELAMKMQSFSSNSNSKVLKSCNEDDFKAETEDEPMQNDFRTNSPLPPKNDGGVLENESTQNCGVESKNEKSGVALLIETARRDGRKSEQIMQETAMEPQSDQITTSNGPEIVSVRSNAPFESLNDLKSEKMEPEDTTNITNFSHDNDDYKLLANNTNFKELPGTLSIAKNGIDSDRMAETDLNKKLDVTPNIQENDRSEVSNTYNEDNLIIKQEADDSIPFQSVSTDNTNTLHALKQNNILKKELPKSGISLLIETLKKKKTNNQSPESGLNESNEKRAADPGDNSNDNLKANEVVKTEKDDSEVFPNHLNLNENYEIKNENSYKMENIQNEHTSSNRQQDEQYKQEQLWIPSGPVSNDASGTGSILAASNNIDPHIKSEHTPNMELFLSDEEDNGDENHRINTENNSKGVATNSLSKQQIGFQSIISDDTGDLTSIGQHDISQTNDYQCPHCVLSFRNAADAELHLSIAHEAKIVKKESVVQKVEIKTEHDGNRDNFSNIPKVKEETNYMQSKYDTPLTSNANSNASDFSTNETVHQLQNKQQDINIEDYMENIPQDNNTYDVVNKLNKESYANSQCKNTNQREMNNEPEFFNPRIHDRSDTKNSDDNINEQHEKQIEEPTKDTSSLNQPVKSSALAAALYSKLGSFQQRFLQSNNLHKKNQDEIVQSSTVLSTTSEAIDASTNYEIPENKVFGNENIGSANRTNANSILVGNRTMDIKDLPSVSESSSSELENPNEIKRLGERKCSNEIKSFLNEIDDEMNHLTNKIGDRYVNENVRNDNNNIMKNDERGQVQGLDNQSHSMSQIPLHNQHNGANELNSNLSIPTTQLSPYGNNSQPHCQSNIANDDALYEEDLEEEEDEDENVGMSQALFTKILQNKDKNTERETAFMKKSLPYNADGANVGIPETLFNTSNSQHPLSYPTNEINQNMNAEQARNTNFIHDQNEFHRQNTNNDYNHNALPNPPGLFSNAMNSNFPNTLHPNGNQNEFPQNNDLQNIRNMPPRTSEYNPPLMYPNPYDKGPNNCPPFNEHSAQYPTELANRNNNAMDMDEDDRNEAMMQSQLEQDWTQEVTTSFNNFRNELPVEEVSRQYKSFDINENSMPRNKTEDFYSNRSGQFSSDSFHENAQINRGLENKLYQNNR